MVFLLKRKQTSLLSERTFMQTEVKLQMRFAQPSRKWIFYVGWMRQQCRHTLSHHFAKRNQKVNFQFHSVMILNMQQSSR